MAKGARLVNLEAFPHHSLQLAPVCLCCGSCFGGKNSCRNSGKQPWHGKTCQLCFSEGKTPKIKVHPQDLKIPFPSHAVTCLPVHGWHWIAYFCRGHPCFQQQSQTEWLIRMTLNGTPLIGQPLWRQSSRSSCLLDRQNDGKTSGNSTIGNTTFPYTLNEAVACGRGNFVPEIL